MKSGVFHPARPKPLVPEKNTQKKIALIEYLLEHIKEPVFTYTNSSLNDEFYIADEDDGLDIPKITFAILNYKGHIGNEINNNFETFGSVIQNYVPERFRNIKFNIHSSTKDYSQAYLDAVEKFQGWICSMKSKIENALSEEYYLQGRMKNLEILKRRYKQNWSESKVVDLTADQNIRMDGDSKIEIKITDA